jgi:hypothetical protein
MNANASILLAEQVLGMDLGTPKGLHAKALARDVLKQQDYMLQTLRLIAHATKPEPDDGGGHENAYELATQCIAAVESTPSPTAREPAQALPQGGEVVKVLGRFATWVGHNIGHATYEQLRATREWREVSIVLADAAGVPHKIEAISASGAGVPVAWRPTCDVVMKQGGDFGPQRVFTPGDVLYASPPSLEAGKAVPLEWKKAVQEAYGWLWHVNNEPTAPVPMWSPEQAAYEARKNLRDLLTKDERGEAINAVSGMLENKARAHGIGTTVSTKEDAL